MIGVGFRHLKRRYLKPLILVVRPTFSISRHFSSTEDGGSSSIDARRQNDICTLLVSGIIGADPIERNIGDGSIYVVNFPLRVMGFQNMPMPIPGTALQKKGGEMWVSVEIWNEEARMNKSVCLKGMPFSGIGHIVKKAWQDKATGQSRDRIWIRVVKTLPHDTVEKLLGTINEALS